MKIKEIGNKKDIFISIDNNISGKWFSKISFIINEYDFQYNEEENLSFLCVDFECFKIAIDNDPKVYKDDYFWQFTDDEIIKKWNKYFNSKTIEEMEDPKIELLDKKFNDAMIPFDSRFFNLWVFIGYLKDDVWYWKVWEARNPKEILNFKISAQSLNEVLLQTPIYLREKILLD
ncbi:hypothetical protein [Flavobacterium reichenbachii]|uniref:Uncharacterized protein n=1 Tax=Flavobacterium reichenbachii TaxID=362418 RepID=A0A085ZPR8_9FLAO|nr:hypothetical protein [Flavobacterium reichenbachii]KFF06432.1 hypothetical protein IW19_13325 [Flavobacterium reichenbachii]OXB11892.1 hypothetical protein B0A68_20545 [Flavobacterium reichenbachii]